MTQKLSTKGKSLTSAAFQVATLDDEVCKLDRCITEMTEKVSAKRKALKVARDRLLRAFNAPAPSTKTKKAEARKARKKMPRLIDAIITVMRDNKKAMSPIDVHNALKKRHWLPVSDDPLGYIRYTLSKLSHEGEPFVRMRGKRGMYRVAPPKKTKQVVVAINSKKAEAVKPAPKKKAEAA
jgi:hypothetical protein